VRSASLWLLLATLFVARPGLAQVPPPSPPSPEAEDAESLSLDAGVGELVEATEEELPAEEETVVEEGELELPEEERPNGYADSTGELDSLDDTDGLRVTVRDRALRAERGYTPLEVILQNSDNVPRQVRLIFRGYGAGATATTRTLELAPRQRLATYLLLPAALQSGTFAVESPNRRTRTANVYLDEANAVSTLVLGAPKAFETGTGMPRAADSVPPLVNVRFIPAQEAPRDLGAYVGYDVVLVTEDAAAVPSDVWAVLDNYAAVGGSLILVRPPRDVDQRLPLLSVRRTRQTWSDYGFGQVFLCEAGAADCYAALVSVEEDSAAPMHAVGAPPRWESNRAALRGGEAPLLPNAMAPVGRFLVLIFLFTLVVGPGGLMLARRKGPAALLIGVPAVALITCLIIVADSVLGDGFVTHASRYSYTFLDRPRDRAITSAVAGYYANLASKKVQMPSHGVLMAPYEVEDWDVDVDWAGGGMVADGFLPARTYLEWAELAVVPTRARLVVSREGGGVKVRNALGAPLRSGYVQLGDKRYALPELEDGAEGLATEMQGERAKVSVESLVAPPLGMKRRTHEDDLKDFTRPLPDRGFVATVGGAGFSPLAAVPVQLHEGVHFVRGEVDGP
jgi:hypothetical protein